jgi:hypothetical protein
MRDYTKSMALSERAQQFPQKSHGWSDERKLAQSERMRGRTLPASWRKAIAGGQRGNKRGPETGRRIAAVLKSHLPTPEEAFWARVEKNEVGCWPWLGWHDKDGYGVVSTKRIKEDPIWREVRAHRISWMLANGVILGGLWVLHRCDNPRCVRPDHLFLGTVQDNVADYMSKGGAECLSQKGERNGVAKLTAAGVVKIRELLREGETQASVAIQFGVSRATIYGINSGRSWRAA